MPFKLSRCICLQTPRFESAVNFYKDVLGLDSVEEGKAARS
jgi:catechol 2,3-dioxygenase-like lactoylglutathione lyase family enzyme